MVQADAVESLPSAVRPLPRPVSRGVRRAAQAMVSIPGADLIHGLDVDLPLRTTAATVTTVHDLSVFDTPWAFSRYRAVGERLLLRRAIGAADEVIAVSAFTAERIHRHLGRQATVIPLAPPSKPAPFDEDAVASVRRRYELPPRFVLQLASIEPRKQPELLAAAARTLNIPVVLAGGLSPRSRVPTDAIHLGYVAEHDLAPLLDAADIVAYISRYEGFGLPPLEAMARSRPVIASRVGALPDVVGDGARLVAVGDEADLVAALRCLWFDDEARAELADAGARQMATLSWSDNARSTFDVYRRLGVEP